MNHQQEFLDDWLTVRKLFAVGTQQSSVVPEIFTASSSVCDKSSNPSLAP